MGDCWVMLVGGGGGVMGDEGSDFVHFDDGGGESKYILTATDEVPACRLSH